MLRRRSLIVLLGVGLLSIWVSVSSAQWQESGTPVCAAGGDQGAAFAVPDGAGGAIFAWFDFRYRAFSDSADIYVQRVDKYGNSLWANNGVPVCVRPYDQRLGGMISDGEGGAILTWQDYRNGTHNDIYAQRVDASGNMMWPVNGALVCGSANFQYAPVIATDGADGAFIAWYDLRGGVSSDIYAQLMDGSGAAQWTPNGEAICTAADSQREPLIAPDGLGAAMIVWEDRRNGNEDIYGERMYPSGEPTWTIQDGVAMVLGQPNSRDLESIAYDGFGGAVFTFSDYRSGLDYDLYAQRMVRGSGSSWDIAGVPVAALASSHQIHSAVVADGSGGVIIVWSDGRNGPANEDIYAQQYEMSGAALWTADGIPVCTAAWHQKRPVAVSDGNGGAIIGWTDSRVSNFGGYLDVYVQNVDGSGSMLWTPDGLAVCREANGQSVTAIVSDGAGGAILGWDDPRGPSFEFDLYAQRIERNGFWGYPAPWIGAVRDVPGDQGGRVNLSWDASRLDPWPEQMISYYSIWRAISPAGAASAVEDGATLVHGTFDVLSQSNTPTIRVEERAGQAFYWDLIDSRTAYYLASYSAAVQTLFDSTSVSNERHYFQIIAHASNPSLYWVSDPDSGYSVDNLAPAAPQGLLGEQSIGPDGLNLSWRRNGEADLAHYTVYRGTRADFVPGPPNQIAAPSDTAMFDGEWWWDSGYYYKVAAVDVHENESPYALLEPETVTGGDDTPPLVNFLAQNYPNPFNPVTTIRYSVAERAWVKLVVYDVAGHRVAVLVDEMQDPTASASVTWSGVDDRGESQASGIYFYRLEINEFHLTRKMVLLK